MDRSLFSQQLLDEYEALALSLAEAALNEKLPSSQQQAQQRSHHQQRQETTTPDESINHTFFSHNPVFDTPLIRQQPAVAPPPSPPLAPLGHLLRSIAPPPGFISSNFVGSNLNNNISTHSSRDDFSHSSSYYSSYEYPPPPPAPSITTRSFLGPVPAPVSYPYQQSHYPSTLTSHHSSTSISSRDRNQYQHFNEDLDGNAFAFNQSDINNNSAVPRRNYRRKLTKTPTYNNSEKRSSLVRQDSIISDLDCSEHSGISIHSGISSISSVDQTSRRSAASATTPNQSQSHLHHPHLHHPSSQNRRGMYNRQDSEHSFCSNTSAASTNSTYSSDVSSFHSGTSNSGKFMHNYKKPVMPPKSQYVAMDCEMVGTLTGHSACARVVLIDWKGRTVLDEFVKPADTVTDYRTFVSGITEDQLQEAPRLAEVRPRVQAALAGKILIGHGLNNDLECLGVEHPWHMIRDTALYEPFMKMNYGQLNPRKLKDLARERLNRDIQVPGQAHSPAEDALAALDLYKSHRPRWEACMTAQIKEGQRLLVEQQKQREQYEQYFAGLPILAFP